MIVRFIIAATVISCTMMVNLSAQSGWTRAQEGYFLQSSMSIFNQRSFYNQDGILTPQDDTFSSENILIYGEYGVSDRMTLLVNMPLIKYHRQSNTETISGTGDIRLGFKYSLLKEIPIAFSVEAEIPTGNAMNLAPIINPGTSTITEVNLPTSDNEYNFWFTLAASKSNSTGKLYGSVFSAVNYRTLGFSPQLQAGLEFGIKPLDPLWLIAKLNIQEKIGTSDPTNSSFLIGQGTTYTSYGLTTFFDITKNLKFTFSFIDYANLVVQQRNWSNGGSYIFGLALEY